MADVIAVHGIATDGEPLFKMAFALEQYGHKVHAHRYEKRHFFSYWFKKVMQQDGAGLLHSAAYRSARISGVNPSVICHSNGQLVVQDAIRQGAKFDKVFIISGAGTSDKFAWPEGSVNEVHWFVNVSDMAVWFGAALPFHPFGKAARRGYAGRYDARQINHVYDRDNWFSIDHSFWFDEEWRPKIASKINRLL